VYDFNGCSATAQITVEVDKNRNVYIPNAFSPNGDGPNDEFRIYTGAGVATVNSVRIFDRWGDILYEATDLLPSNGGIPTWDGTFKGKQLDPAVFVYLVEVTFLDGLKLLYRGDITLLR
jgi:gliding motility-associated-like protein